MIQIKNIVIVNPVFPVNPVNFEYGKYGVYGIYGVYIKNFGNTFIFYISSPLPFRNHFERISIGYARDRYHIVITY